MTGPSGAGSPNFPNRYISWEGGHALKRCEERKKSPAEVEQVIRTSPFVMAKADGRYDIDGCVGGEMTRVVVVETRADALVVVTVYGRGVKCS